MEPLSAPLGTICNFPKLYGLQKSHHLVVPSLHDFLFGNTKDDIFKNVWVQTTLDPLTFF